MQCVVPGRNCHVWVALEVVAWSTHVKVNKTGKARGCRAQVAWGFLHAVHRRSDDSLAATYSLHSAYRLPLTAARYGS